MEWVLRPLFFYCLQDFFAVYVLVVKNLTDGLWLFVEKVFIMFATITMEAKEYEQ